MSTQEQTVNLTAHHKALIAAILLQNKVLKAKRFALKSIVALANRKESAQAMGDIYNALVNEKSVAILDECWAQITGELNDLLSQPDKAEVVRTAFRHAGLDLNNFLKE